MSRPSNLYAERIFSEHPIAMWALDEQSDYVSLINEDFRTLSDETTWTVTNGEISIAPVNSSVPLGPFPESHTSFSITEDDDAEQEIELLSDFVPNIFPSGILSFDDLSSDLGTFCVGMYVYSESENTIGYEIGYTYFDSVSAESVEVTKSFDIPTSGRWLHVSATFPIPDQDVPFKLLFRTRVSPSITENYEHKIYYNGLTLGQWSEEFCSTSLGSEVADLPPDVEAFLTSNYRGIEARSYSREDIPGYYITDGVSVYAKNSGVPLVYGADNSTVIYPNGDNPSLVIPGLGFMNELGKYKTSTVEMWINVNSSGLQAKKIFGPVGSNDGLYVDGAFLSLKINSNYISHYVGEWSRPMLVNIRYSESAATLMVNGEEVASTTFDSRAIVFPSADSNGSSNDWLGFYGHEQISPFLVDCVAIYSYKVPPVVAKRRFVYGQGVEFPENINNAYSGTTTFFDYSFSKYSNNYSYPGSGSWNQGFVNNLNIENNYLATKSFAKPATIFDSSGADLYSEWKSDNLLAQNEDYPFFSIKPNSDWDNINGYLYLESLNVINDKVAAFYGIFKVSELVDDEQILFRIDDKQQSRYFEIVLVDNVVSYRFKDGSANTITLYQTESVIPGEQFTIGIDIKNFVNYFGVNTRSFFSNQDGLSMSIGGSSEQGSTFSGKIYSVSILNANSLMTVPYMFSSRGTPVDYEYGFDEYDSFVLYDAGDKYFGNDGSYWQHLLDGGTPTSFITSLSINHVGTYTIKAKEMFDEFRLSVASSSSWEDYLPLTSFARYITDQKGNSYYDLDFIQFNIDYPAPSVFSRVVGEPTQWSYGDLYQEYSLPTKKTYELLANHLFTGYDNYEDLANRSSFGYVYDTSDSVVKTYIMFSYVSSVYGSLSGKYFSTESLPKSGIVRPGEDWLTTRYEVVDNSIIYPPSGVDVNQLAITTQVEIVNPDTDIYPVSIRSIQYSPQSLDKSSPTAVGTRFGVDVSPYRQNGFYVDYAGDNPFSIYKGSTPYLYNTRYSGIQPRGEFSPLVNRGVSIPVNPEKTRNYEIIAMQISLRYDEDFFPISPVQIFEVQGRRDHIKFFLVSTSPNGKRAKIYAVNAKTGQLDANVGLYINGRITKDATITVKEWATLGVSFSKILDVSLTAGSIRINGPILANNISYYQSTSLEEVQDTQNRVWEDVLMSGAIELEWDFWDSFIWNDVLVLTSTSLLGVSPAEIYKAFTGTNRIVVDDYSATALNQPDKLVFKDYQYSIYSDISWYSTTRSAL